MQTFLNLNANKIIQKSIGWHKQMDFSQKKTETQMEALQSNLTQQKKKKKKTHLWYCFKVPNSPLALVQWKIQVQLQPHKEIYIYFDIHTKELLIAHLNTLLNSLKKESANWKNKDGNANVLTDINEYTHTETYINI